MAEVLCGVRVHFKRTLGMAQVKLQRQRRHQQKRQRRQQRQPVGRLHRFHVEDALQRRQDERARHQPGDEGIEHDQHAPLQLDFVRVHEAFNTLIVAAQPDSLMRCFIADR